MKADEFNIIVEDQFSECRATLCRKAEEYATGADRLHNFKRAAALEQTTQEKAVVGMWSKHLVSVLDIADTAHVNLPDMALLDEKITDLINYAVLLKASIVERVRAAREQTAA